MEDKRIRLVFKDDDILNPSQKLDGLDRSWLLLRPNQYDTVSDVASHLLRVFQLHHSCPHGLLLSISGFVLPPFESTHILKDNEIIRVRKRRDVLAITGNNAATDVEKLKAVEMQPVNNGVLFLANDEFVKEKGGYESDHPDEESEEDLEEGQLKDVENPSGVNADPKSRKRKAAEKLPGGNKKKKLRSAAAEIVADGGRAKKKNVSSEEKKDDSNAEDNADNNEGTTKLSDTSHVPVSDIKRNIEVQENAKETEDAKSAANGKKKVPSRSARRKYVKRRWLKEMAKIQKQNANCESEGLRNWKEDHAKAERKKGNDEWKGLKKWKKHQADGEINEVDDQPKGLKKWKKHLADGERNEVDDQPKGLLHWKQSPQSDWVAKGKKRQKGYFHKYPKGIGDANEQKTQNGDELEKPTQNSDELGQPTQNGDELGQPNQKQDDTHEQPGKKSGGVQEHPNQNYDASEKRNEDSEEENEVVPIVIRPGHIRFEPLGKEQNVQQNHVPTETFQWNGITSKKKGQQWGKENRSFTPRNDYKNSNKESSEIFSVVKEKQPDEVVAVDFDKLPPLTTMPKEGDLIAYRILELSSTWTPELSSFRVGKVSCYDAESNQTIVLPVAEYPIVSQKTDEGEVEQPDNALYKEDGSLEIDFSTLIDVRIFKSGSSGLANEALSQLSEGSIGNENAANTVLPSGNNNQTVEPTPENDGVNVWDQLGEALNAKKEQLSKENGWGKTPPKKIQASPTNNWGKNTHKVQHSQGNRMDKQSSGGKPWSYKALRSNGLGQTMTILRSKKD